MNKFKYIYSVAMLAICPFTVAQSQDTKGKNLSAVESNAISEKILAKIPLPLVNKNDIFTNKAEEKVIYAVSCWQKGILIFQGFGLDPNVQARDSITMPHPSAESSVANQGLRLINMGETFCVISKK